VLHRVFSPTAREIAWAREVVTAFDAAGGAGLRLPSGEFVDLPVARRAHRLLDVAASLAEPAVAAGGGR
jgi:citrate lyase subunit beta/citryl-CoA lyase